MSLENSTSLKISPELSYEQLEALIPCNEYANNIFENWFCDLNVSKTVGYSLLIVVSIAVFLYLGRYITRTKFKKK